MYMLHSFLFHHSNYVLASTMYTPQQHPQPAPTPPPANIPHGFNMEAQVPFRPWSTGMCDCMDDVLNCCITCWCPCITFGQVAEIIDRGASSCGTAGALYGLLFSMAGFHWVYSCTYRSKLRMQYNLMEAPCCDCCVHYCCELCSLCQMYRELKNQGFDMSIGWHMNMQRGVTPVSRPPAVQGMAR